MRICAECQHCRMDRLQDICRNPHVLKVDVVTGLLKGKACREVRGLSGLCGQQGAWFDPKVKPVSWWRRIFGRS